MAIDGEATMAQRTVLENPGSVGEAPEFPGCRPMQKALASRGQPGLGRRLEARDLAGVTDEEVIDALLGSKDESGFRARLQGLRRRPG